LYLRFEALCRPLGLTFNASKSEWFGGLNGAKIPQPLADVGVREVVGCVKILGSYIGSPEAVRAKLLQKLKKHEHAFGHLLAMDPSPATYALLIKCLLPRQGYHMRTHNPEDSEELCREFDRRVFEVINQWFDISPEDRLALEIASLPKRDGGNGLVFTSPLRGFAYEDSLYRALHSETGKEKLILTSRPRHDVKRPTASFLGKENNDVQHGGISLAPLDTVPQPPIADIILPDAPTPISLVSTGHVRQRPKSQRDATRELHLTTKKRISQEGPQALKVARVLEINSLKGSGDWIDTPSQWMPPAPYAASWRLRCLATALSLPAGAQCPGCPRLGVMSQVDFMLHAQGCTRCPTQQNATAAHDRLTSYLHKHASENAVYSEIEPRGFQTFTCDECGAVFSGMDTRSQLRAHARRCGVHVHRRGVDLEIWLNRRRRMVDFTIVHATCSSLMTSSLPSIIRQKQNRKDARYVDSGLVPKEEFIMAAAFSSGALDVGFKSLLRDIAEEAHTDFVELVEGVRNVVMWGQGAAVDAAFRVAAARGKGPQMY